MTAETASIGGLLISAPLNAGQALLLRSFFRIRPDVRAYYAHQSAPGSGRYTPQPPGGSLYFCCSLFACAVLECSPAFCACCWAKIACCLPLVWSFLPCDSAAARWDFAADS